jgi:hypothetical protein
MKKKQVAEVVIPKVIKVEVTEEDIQMGFPSFHDNPTFKALKRAKHPVTSVGPDLAYIGGREYIADLEGAEQLGRFLNKLPVLPYKVEFKLSDVASLWKRQKERIPR